MAVQSPCIGICRINVRSGQCEGCWRTVEEIAAWPKMADGQRQQLVLVLEQRQEESASFD
jgi:hypothetical protein